MKTPVEIRESIFNDSLIPVCMELKNCIMNGEIITDKSDKIREAVNKIFDDIYCTSVIFTNNTDKILFGIRVNPIITDNDLLSDHQE